MFGIIRDWVTFGPGSSEDRQVCTLNEKIVKILRGGLYETTQDFMDLFRSEPDARLVHCDTEVAVDIPRGNDLVLIDVFEKECEAARRVIPAFHPSDYEIYKDDASAA